MPKGVHRTKCMGPFSMCFFRSSTHHPPSPSSVSWKAALCELRQHLVLSSGFQLRHPMEVSSPEEKKDGVFIARLPPHQGTASWLSPAMKGHSFCQTALSTKLLSPGASNHHPPFSCPFRPRRGKSHLFPAGTLTQKSNSMCCQWISLGFRMLNLEFYIPT